MKAFENIINMQRLKSAIKSFTDMQISRMFNIPLSKRTDAIRTLDRLITEQERYIAWLAEPKAIIRTTPEQDASINAMYEAQLEDAKRLGLLPRIND